MAVVVVFVQGQNTPTWTPTTSLSPEDREEQLHLMIIEARSWVLDDQDIPKYALVCRDPLLRLLSGV